MRIRVRAFVESARASLFLVPMFAVVLAIVVGQLGIELDSRLDGGASPLPFVLTSTVASARSVLSTIAAATISFAGIAFSVSLLIIQLGASQYSPRVVHTLFRDPFNKRVMGMVIGTFTYCLIVLRSVRSLADEGEQPVVPNLSVSVAVLLGIGAILATVAFINHSAHTMDISEILDRVSREAIDHVHGEWPAARRETEPREATTTPPTEQTSVPSFVVRFERTGWVQQMDVEGLMRCVPKGGSIVMHSGPGHYAIARTALCTMTPVPPPDDLATIERRVRGSLGIGDTRTMQQDASYGLRQLVDVALKALSPAVNDPTTAQDAIFHAGGVLAEMLHHHTPATLRLGDDDRRLVLEAQPTHDALVDLTFDETRRAAAPHPTVCLYLLDTLARLRDSVLASGLSNGVEALERQARMVRDGIESEANLPADRGRVRRAFADGPWPDR